MIVPGRLRRDAMPVDSAANEALVRLLANVLDLPRNRVELVRGGTSRHKVIKLHGLTVAEAGAFSRPVSTRFDIPLTVK